MARMDEIGPPHAAQPVGMNETAVTQDSPPSSAGANGGHGEEQTLARERGAEVQEPFDSWGRPRGHAEYGVDPAAAKNKSVEGAAQGGGDDPFAGRLQHGWQAITSRSSGETFFWHEGRDETRWEPPLKTDDAAEYAAAAAVAAEADQATEEVVQTEEASSAASPKASGCVEDEHELPPGWSAEVSRKTGEVFYHNSNTGETQWEVPGIELPEDWVAVSSRTTGETFYYNEKSGDTTWEKPKIERAVNKLKAVLALSGGLNAASASAASAGAVPSSGLPLSSSMKAVDSPAAPSPSQRQRWLSPPRDPVRDEQRRQRREAREKRMAERQRKADAAGEPQQKRPGTPERVERDDLKGKHAVL